MKDKIGNLFHKLYSRLMGKQGFASWRATKKMTKILDNIKPDIVHLHNIHNSSINIEILINYLKDHRIKTFWTFHDCWAFTGKCVHFEQIKCNKWKTECKNCPILNESPISYIDKSQWNYNKKRKLLSNMDLTIITPSKWLANHVKESFLKNYPIIVINNGIDTDIFKPTKNNFRKKYSLLDKKIILGVANPWTAKKGLNDFINLSEKLDDTYRIVLIGLNKKQLESIPNNILGISKTNNQQELANIYSSADVLFNPTYEDNYPTINIEAIACGTPVLTYDTGGSPEFVQLLENNKNIYVISKTNSKNVLLIKEYIDRLINSSIKLKDARYLDEKRMVNQYIKLYKIDKE